MKDMNMKELNFTSSIISFSCDSCNNKFSQTIAYSPTSDLTKTYCSNCIKFTDEKTQFKRPKSKNQWESPPTETSENLSSLNLDKRTLTKTGRVHQLGTRVKKEFLEQLKSIAYQERLKYVEVLEKALQCYEKHRKKYE